MADRVIYTCVTGGYDSLNQPKVIYDGYDYICFTDEVRQERIGIWQIRKIPSDLQDKIRLSRYLKINPHKVLSNYRYSVYIDSNILILDDYLLNRVETEIKNNSLIALSKHPENREDIYEEAAYVMKYRRAKFSDVKQQVKYLLKKGYPRRTGMYENNIIFRQHNHKDIIKLDEDWWNIYMRFTYRDQLSFAYVLWNNNIIPADLLADGERMNVTAKIKSPENMHLQRILHSKGVKNNPSTLKKYWKYLIYLSYEIPRFQFLKLYFQYIIRFKG